MNHNLEILCNVNILLDKLIYHDLILNIWILEQIQNYILQIKSDICFLITKYYFISIIEFDARKQQIMHKLKFIGDIFFTYSLNNVSIIEKINYIRTMVKHVIYPAHSNANNFEKYIGEIKQTKINFYHKFGTIDENLYKEKIDLEDGSIDLEDKFIDLDLDLDLEDGLTDLDLDLDLDLKNGLTDLNSSSNVSKGNKIYVNEIDYIEEKNYVINKIKGLKFLSNIDFTKSSIKI